MHDRCCLWKGFVDFGVHHPFAGRTPKSVKAAVERHFDNVVDRQAGGLNPRRRDKHPLIESYADVTRRAAVQVVALRCDTGFDNLPAFLLVCHVRFLCYASSHCAAGSAGEVSCFMASSTISKISTRPSLPDLSSSARG